MKIKVNLTAVELRAWNFEQVIDVDDAFSEDEIDELLSEIQYNLVEAQQPIHAEYEEVSYTWKKI